LGYQGDVSHVETTSGEIVSYYLGFDRNLLVIDAIIPMGQDFIITIQP
jgi:hypothetical protein